MFAWLRGVTPGVASADWLDERGGLGNTLGRDHAVVVERLYSATQVARQMNWRLNTVYRKRSRSLRKLAERGELMPTDLPPGQMVPGQGLRWKANELRRFSEATRSSRNRGGRPRARRDI